MTGSSGPTRQPPGSAQVRELGKPTRTVLARPTEPMADGRGRDQDHAPVHDGPPAALRPVLDRRAPPDRRTVAGPRKALGPRALPALPAPPLRAEGRRTPVGRPGAPANAVAGRRPSDPRPTTTSTRVRSRPTGA